MDALEAITGRRAQRAFDRRRIDPKAIRKIVDAGRHAMSARNLQPWRFVVVENCERLSAIGALSSTGRFVADAPAAVVVLKEVANTRWADIDCGQAVQNMANAAWALGLGTCWVGNFDGGKIGEMLGIPDDWAIFTILSFGYQDPKNPPQARPLKSREQQVFYERYGQGAP